MYAIEAEGLVKRFGKTTALAGADLAARTGTVLGLLGPNGAGKTTAVRILATLLRPDGGRASVAGYDVVRDAHRVRQLIALTGQYASVDDGLSGTNNLIMIGRLLGIGRRRRPGPRGQPAGPVRAVRRRGTAGEDVLRRHAPAARSRGQPGRPAPGLVPRRAQHRPGPAKPGRGVGADPGAGRRRRHGLAHHPVPGGGRPPGQRGRGHRPRPGRRHRDAGRAEGQDRRAGAGGRPRRPGPACGGGRDARPVHRCRADRGAPRRPGIRAGGRRGRAARHRAAALRRRDRAHRVHAPHDQPGRGVPDRDRAPGR